MKAEVRALVRYRLERAEDSLREADALLAVNAPRGAVNRCYYAALYAARALLALRGLDSARHAGVIALFQQTFVTPGVVDVDVARALPRAFARRLKVDYDDFAVVTTDEATAVRDDVKPFVAECRRIADRLMTDDDGA